MQRQALRVPTDAGQCRDSRQRAVLCRIAFFGGKIMRPDDEIRHDVQEELDWDPLIGARDIAVSVRDGVVTLAGFVRSLGEKRRAESDAKHVAGVSGLANDIEVRLPLFGRKPDPQVAREVVRSIKNEIPTAAERIRLRVSSGRVTLEGEVDWDYQRARAEEVAARVKGVTGITNDILVKTLQVEIKCKIEAAFDRIAAIDAEARRGPSGAHLHRTR
jgi:osmotically-inducible protein OsmY